MSGTDQLHILQIIKGLDIGGHNGGSENFGVRLARQLRKTGVSVSLCAYYQYHTPIEAELVERLDREGILVVFANHTPMLNLWEGYLKLSRFLRDHPVEVVHSHFQVGTLTGILLKLSGKIRFLMRTAHTPLEFGTSFTGQVARWIFVQGVYPLALDKELAVSQTLVSGLNHRPVARCTGKQATCIYNALSEVPGSDQAGNPFASFTHEMPDDLWVMTMIGILNPLKCFDTAIRAMPIILAEIPHARLVLVGRGPEEARLRQIAVQTGVTDQVWFLGQRVDIAEILARTNLFIHPSVLEALSTVILEAMKCGVPAAAADIPGNRELIEDGVNGWLFPPKDERALAEIVLEAYRHPERGKSFALEAARRLEKFSLPVVTGEYLQTYRRLVERCRI